MKKKFTGYIGTYTKGKSEGIYSFTLDTLTLKISDIQLAAKIDNPTYLTISQNKQYLYSVAKAGDLGGVASFTIADDLQLINQQMSEGAPPCHVSTDNQNRYLFAGNYHKGTVEMYDLDMENGAIQPDPSFVTHIGTGPDVRQEKAHTHYTALTPDEKYLLVIDLGIDQLITYEINNGALTEVAHFAVKPGSGPRHLVFHPREPIAYLMTEFSSEVFVLHYHEKDGSFSLVQSISTIPADFDENNQGSAIHISSDGRFVYAANRGHNSIASFSVNEENQKLSFVEHTATKGNWPRDFALDPSEKFVVVANQESSNMVLFSRDEETGKLTLLECDLNVPDPVCVKFLHE
jgi:6-phosphogluconolactonase